MPRGRVGGDRAHSSQKKSLKQQVVHERAIPLAEPLFSLSPSVARTKTRCTLLLRSLCVSGFEQRCSSLSFGPRIWAG
ncbi:hypothetical protein BKA66DRAFT_453926 [Pyrenochaeta sp. MPI-SDFR-AT-0127]|nr:hypothetical protein BKA66DRAFT_453926 [Pyrenochaeta sp. MPI-SDFR-AT-0127]